MYIATYYTVKSFQSPLPRGERRGGANRIKIEILYFNPRSREGSDNHLDKQRFL